MMKALARALRFWFARTGTLTIERKANERTPA
jgi:hypothetical protein